MRSSKFFALVVGGALVTLFAAESASQAAVVVRTGPVGVYVGRPAYYGRAYRPYYGRGYYRRPYAAYYGRPAYRAGYRGYAYRGYGVRRGYYR